LIAERPSRAPGAASRGIGVRRASRGTCIQVVPASGGVINLSFLRPYRNMGEGWKQKVHDLVTIATEGEESDVDS